MKTNQMMERQFMGNVIHQRTVDSWFNATDLLTLYNESPENKPKKFSEFWANNSTKDFLEALANEVNSNVGKSGYLKNVVTANDLYETKRGNQGATWMHPYLFIEFSAWLSASFRVKLYKWIYDNLIDFRNQVGDHYKEMCEAIYITYEDFYSKKPDPLLFIKEANYINLLVFGTTNGKKRNEASEEELELLNKLQLANIKLLKEKISGEDRRKRLRDFAILY